MEPIAKQFDLKIVILPELRESDGYALPETWQHTKAADTRALGGAYAAGRGLAALEVVRAELQDGRALLCTHGDVLPMLLASLRGSEGFDFPAPHEQRGGWTTLIIDGSRIDIHQQGLIAGFPS